MQRVPTFDRETRYNGTPLPYQHYETNGDTFGASIANATQNVGNAMQNLGASIQQAQDNIDDAKMLELSNQIEQWQQDNLYDKENGYYNKMGKDAANKSQEIMDNYEKFVTDYTDKNRISGLNKQRLNYMLAQKKDRISKGVFSHDIEQTKVWAQTEGSIGIDNAIKGMVQGRNNPDEVKTNLDNAIKIVEWQGKTMNMDESSVALAKKDVISKGYSSILDTLISEHDLSAKSFFDEHKDEINSNLHPRYIEQIKNEEDKYIARSTANSIIAGSSSEAEAIKKAEQIENIDMSDQVVSRIKRHYSEVEQAKNEAEKNALNNFYNTVIQKTQSGEQISYDDIPDGLEPQTKLSLMNYVNKNGEPDNDESIWKMLYDKQVNDAQGFAKEDLNKYRGYLSDSEYKSFVEKQQEIQAGGYYTTIKDDNELIDTALETLGLNKGKKEKVAYSEIRSMVREFEARKGRKITDSELLNITNSLGYKDANNVAIYKQIEKGMAEQNGFIRDVINDFAYYQKSHNGELPSNDEKAKIINRRVSGVVVQQNNGLRTSLTTERTVKKGDVWNGHIITSTYGTRVAPTTGASTDHKGIDLAYKNNEAFPAFASGTVVSVGKSQSLGNYVDIKASDGSIHRYGHANSITVKKGQKVSAGQMIGRAGSTGVSTGPHLHYAKLINGQFVDPLKVQPVRIATNSQRRAF